MREIKFRAWDIDLKKMLYSAKKDHTFEYKPRHAKHFDHPRIITMQYTGLKDSKNREIYEGDILTKRTRTSFEPPIGNVEFYDGGFVMNWKDGKSFERIYERLMRHFQIIGNIYENPELLG